MKKIVLIFLSFLLMLPVTVFGQDNSEGLNKAIDATLQSLSLRDSSRYVISGGDTIFENKDSLSFSQALRYKAITENEVRTVCGFSFGTPYEFIRYALEKKFGSPAYLASSNILYKNILYGGLICDDISFLFNQDPDGNNYLNQVVFINTASSREDALQIKEYIQRDLSWDYTSVQVLDDDLTVGGLPPGIFQLKGNIEDPVTTTEKGYGFEIRIIPPDTEGYPYFVRVMFGPYEGSFEHM